MRIYEYFFTLAKNGFSASGSPARPIFRAAGGDFFVLSVWTTGNIGPPSAWQADFEIKRLFFFYTDKFSQICTEQILNAMKRWVLYLIPLLMLGACDRSAGFEENSQGQDGVYHGMIELGEKLDDENLGVHYELEDLGYLIMSFY